MSAALLAKLRRNRIPGDNNAANANAKGPGSVSVQSRDETPNGSNVTEKPSSYVAGTTTSSATKTSNTSSVASNTNQGSAPTQLTGSAELLARLRKNNISGQRASSTSNVNDSGAEKTTIYVLYGGEMANDVGCDVIGKNVISNLSKQAREHVTMKCMCMDEFEKCRLDKKSDVDAGSKKIAIIVVETIENAQPAEAAGAMVRYFNRMRKNCSENDKPLKGLLHFAVLGLGDTNLLMDRQTTSAKDCNQAAQTLDAALLSLGANQLIKRGEANDATGLEEDVEKWLQLLWPALDRTCTPVAVSNGADSTKSENGEVLVLYGSQTGNSMEIAQNISAEAPSHSIKSSVKSLDDIKFLDLVGSNKIILVVVSSTGDGDAPDNAARFHTQLKKRSNPSDLLKGIKFAVLGMGDQNYSAFMAVPRSFNRRFLECGAECYYKRGEIDEIEGIEQQVEVWLEGFWVALAKAVDQNGKGETAGDILLENKSQQSEATNGAIEGSISERCSEMELKKWGTPPLPNCSVVLSHVDAKILSKATETEMSSTIQKTLDGDNDHAYSAANPFQAQVNDAYVMTSLTSDRRVICLDLDTSKGDLIYIPGDSIGIVPENDPELVSALVHRLKLEESKVFNLYQMGSTGANGEKLPALSHIKCPCSVYDAFLRYVDITSVPRKNLVRLLAEHAIDSSEQRELMILCSKEGRAKYKDDVIKEEPNLLELLERYPSCEPPIEHLLELLPPLMPRMYSVCSSQMENPHSVQVAFSVVNIKKSQNRIKRGVATNWMDRTCASLLDSGSKRQKGLSISLPIFHRSGGEFKVPENDSTPIIMIGPGTGVAPFRGFLQERRCRKSLCSTEKEIGPSWLFFGCRNDNEDYLFKDDFQTLFNDGTLSKLDVAFSRASETKVYVQDKMKLHAQELRDWILHSGAHIFVCGDGAHMAKDVHEALIDILCIDNVNSGQNMPDGNGVHEEEEKRLTREQATKYLKRMQNEKKYIRDIWS